MANLKICRICLQTEAKVYNYVQYQLKSYYEEILALKLSEMDSLPQYFCFQCAILLHKYHKFKEKCHFGQKILQEILWKGPITYETVKMIDTTNLKLLHKSPQQNVIFIDASENEIHPIDNITIKEEDKNEGATEKIENVDDNKNLDDDDNFEMAFDDNQEIDVSVTEISTPVLRKPKNKIKDKNTRLKAKERKSKVKRKEDNVKDKNSNNKSDQNKEKVVKRLILMDASKWKKFDLTEEEAIQEFRAKSYDEKYTAAAYKCTDCLKGFSEEDMLKRHIKIRHSESQGSIECQFCRMRFKRKCRLRQHIREHYTKFKCLRCNFICVLESTALSHEQFHNGVTRKCKYCGKEFRYSSTYYTHLRTHRSQFVCTLCGSSFVSEAGLHQHKRVKHCTSDKNLEKEDKEEEANKFCSRCNIQFETTKAYEEHLYHSTLHADENGIDIDVTKTLNILERATQERVTSLFKRRKIDDISFKSGKRCKKPTTCHQCGKHFSTQSACMKHHLEEHPGTSFCPPNLRHICEICGASLAPGSVAVHKNMHTREKIFACSTCGRQFYESVGLKRHMLTHTGEKPFACTSCDKRFTQSASLKLHYRTFHLKQPYPKRNRRKKE